MEAAGTTLFWLGFLCAIGGAIAWPLLHFRGRKAEFDSMTADQRAWWEAESVRKGAIKAAEKDHKSTTSQEAKRLRDAEKALADAQAVGTRPLGAVGGVRLNEDQVQVAGSTFKFCDGPLSTRVDSIAPSSSGGKTQAGSVTFWVSGARGSASANLHHGQLAAAQALASRIEAASRDWPSLRETAAEGVAASTAALAEARARQSTAVEQSAAAVSAVRADRDEIERVRSKIATAFCSKCGRNVAVVDEKCPSGHTELSEYQPDHPRTVQAAARPKRAIRAAQAACAVGMVVLIAGLSLLPPASPAPSVAAAPDPERVTSVPATQAAEEPTVAAPVPEPNAEPVVVAEEPAPEPQPAEFTAQEQLYAEEVLVINGEVTDAIGELSTILQSDPTGVWTDEETRMEVIVQMAVVKTGYPRVKELRPSARLKPAHEDLVEAMRLYDKSMDALAGGIDNVDEEKIARAAELMGRGSEKMAAASEKINELANQ